jgi:hypothetical protein
MPTYEEMLLAALQNPPDRNERQPPANRKSTIYGVVISFCVCSHSGTLYIIANN